MTAVDGDALRRLADVVDALQETPIDIEGAQLLSADDDAVRGQLTMTVPNAADLEAVTIPSPDDLPLEDETRSEDDTDENKVLDHTETEDLQLAYDEADGNISAAADRFNVGYGAVYRRMVKHGVHETENSDSDKSGTSTEDDTHQSEQESEAPDVDLEEDTADDAPEENGDDVQEEPDAEEITVDAVDGDGSDEIDVELPDGVTPTDVEAAVDEYETLGDVGNEIGVTRGRARTITVALGCYGDVSDTRARGGR
ncbi:hypothetical protein [Natronorubrum halophilum]|uniref:hypothetical protein n=1 Tax=Natronorubrum halophilum TaxID=1702106 RepID=UPI0010C18C8E|nr:hypothetical protein [Natronorubrum halophilum]